MTRLTDLSLLEQRQALRQQLQTQRQLIKRQIEPQSSGSYPRSMTLHLLLGQPALIAGLLAGLATLLVGGRFVKSVTTALVLARAVRAAASSRRHGHKSAPRIPDHRIDPTT